MAADGHKGRVPGNALPRPLFCARLKRLQQTTASTQASLSTAAISLRVARIWAILRNEIRRPRSGANNAVFGVAVARQRDRSDSRRWICMSGRAGVAGPGWTA
jgi:hypothetical protein